MQSLMCVRGACCCGKHMIMNALLPRVTTALVTFEHKMARMGVCLQMLCVS